MNQPKNAISSHSSIQISGINPMAQSNCSNKHHSKV